MTLTARLAVLCHADPCTRSSALETILTPLHLISLCKLSKCGDSQNGTGHITSRPLFFWIKAAGTDACLRSGVILTSVKGNTLGDNFVHVSFKNLRDRNFDAVSCPDSASIKSHFDPAVPTGAFPDEHGYYNPIGGWAEATRGTKAGLDQVRKLGGTIRAGAAVENLIIEGRTVHGVVLKGGEEIRGDLVVVSRSTSPPSMSSD